MARLEMTDPNTYETPMELSLLIHSLSNRVKEITVNLDEEYISQTEAIVQLKSVAEQITMAGIGVLVHLQEKEKFYTLDFETWCPENFEAIDALFKSQDKHLDKSFNALNAMREIYNTRNRNNPLYKDFVWDIPLSK